MAQLTAGAGLARISGAHFSGRTLGWLALTKLAATGMEFGRSISRSISSREVWVYIASERLCWTVSSRARAPSETSLVFDYRFIKASLCRGLRGKVPSAEVFNCVAEGVGNSPAAGFVAWLGALARC